MGKKFPLSVVLETIDKSTKTIQKINDKFGGLGKSLDKIRTRFQLLDKEAGLSKSLEGVKKSAKSLAVYGAIAGFVANKLVRGFTQQGEAIADASERLGVGVEWLQKMRHAGERNQLTVEETDDALDKFSKTIGETAAGTGKAKDIFKAWGLSVFDANGKVKTMEQLLPEVADKLGKIEDASVRNAVASRLFGDSGKALALAMKDGSKGLQAYFEEAERFGVMTEEQAMQAKEFEDRMQDLRKGFEGVRNSLVGPLIPSLTKFLVTLSEFMQKNREAMASFGRALLFIAGIFAAFKVLSLIWSLVVAVKAIGLVFIGVAAAISAPVWAIIAGIAAISAAGYMLVKNWESIKQWWDGIWEAIGATVFNMVARITGAWQNLKSGNLVGAFDSAFGSGPSAAATAGNSSAVNTNNASVKIDINGLGKNDTVKTQADKGMPFSINQGYTAGGSF